MSFPNANTATAPRWLSILFALIGVGAITGAWFMAQKQLTILRDWPTIDAEVLTSDITSHRDSDDNSTTYGVRVEFRFALNGNDVKASSDRGYTTSSYSSMQKVAERFSPGTRHPIRYNPQQSTDIRFNADYTLEFFGVPVFLAAFGLIFLVVGFVSTRAKGRASAVALAPNAPGACPTCGASVPPEEKFCPKCGTMLHEG